MTGTMEIKLNSNLETELEGNIKKGISAALEGVISRGIKACRIDDDGQLIFTLTDDSELDIGKVTGEDGVSITGISTQTSSASSGDNVVTITLSDGTISTFTIKNGAKGERGEQGIQGVQGEKGDKGDTGEQGIQGIQGIQGPKGDKGDTGARGPQGEQGIQGPKGDKGDKGEKGDVGPQGPAGSGTGDMMMSTYDPNRKLTDIFGYVDTAIGSLPKPTSAWDDITGKPSAFPPTEHTHSQYLTEEEDPTVPSWAKASTKPTYTAEEVGALPEDKIFWATYGATTYAEITQAVADGKIILCWYSNRLYKYGGLSTYHYFVCDLTATSSYYARVNSSNTWSASSSTALTSSIYVKSTATTAASDSNVYTALRTKNELSALQTTIEAEIPTVSNDFTDDYKSKVDSLWEDYQLALGVI